MKLGVELEYMVVDASSLDTRPIVPELIDIIHPSYEDEIPRGAISISHELASHVIELKTNGPVESVKHLAPLFLKEVNWLNEHLKSLGAKLMPTAMHPWMEPLKDSKLWHRGYREVYEKFDEIFQCRGHGWTNLQSVHLNVGFDNDENFLKYHALLRIISAILPALTASSPLCEGRHIGYLDTRMHAYKSNCKRIPSITGKVVPESIRTPDEYQKKILSRIYRDISPLDPDGILQHEWLNARGVIARFERKALELRVMDIQESPVIDLAILELIVALLVRWQDNRASWFKEALKIKTSDLAKVFQAAIAGGLDSRVPSQGLLDLIGIKKPRASFADLWKGLAREVNQELTAPELIGIIIEQGNLASRILRRCKTNTPTRELLREIYGELAACLEAGQPYLPKQS